MNKIPPLAYVIVAVAVAYTVIAAIQLNSAGPIERDATAGAYVQASGRK